MVRLGLGHLTLGRSSTTLSGGEAQRVRIASVLHAARRRPALLVLDEPDRGLSSADQARLTDAFGALTDTGHTLVVITHSRQLLASADGSCSCETPARYACANCACQACPAGYECDGSCSAYARTPYELTPYDVSYGVGHTGSLVAYTNFNMPSKSSIQPH